LPYLIDHHAWNAVAFAVQKPDAFVAIDAGPFGALDPSFLESFSQPVETRWVLSSF
jgi:hypothetical protein